MNQETLQFKDWFKPLSPNRDKNEISLNVITYLFKHSSVENKGSDHQGWYVLISLDKYLP